MRRPPSASTSTSSARNAEIADALLISPGTAKVHVARILAKPNLDTRAQAAVFAYRHGVVTWTDQQSSRS